MDALRYVALAGLLVVAILAGGAGIRLLLALGDLPAAATLGLVAVLVVWVALLGARGRRSRSNPYW